MKCTCNGFRPVFMAASALALLACAGGALAGGTESLASQVAPLAAHADASLGVSPEQRLRDDLRVLLLDMVESGAFGKTPTEQIALSINEPRQRAGGLGVLVDSASGSKAVDGLQVLGTTPGSSASRMGLRAGDILASVNDVTLAGLGDDAEGGARAAQVLRDQVDGLADGALLVFKVVRDGRIVSVSGNLLAAWIPAIHLTVGDGVAVASAAARSDMPAKTVEGCGRISIFDVAPRQRHLHAAALIDIDGTRSPMGGQIVFRVPAGPHVISVGERIESRYLGFNNRFRNSNAMNPYKQITVNVRPNTTYFLAAQLNQDKSTEWVNGAYWDPMIWKESTESCD